MRDGDVPGVHNLHWVFYCYLMGARARGEEPEGWWRGRMGHVMGVLYVLYHATV